jgi:hypothetical protein
MGTAIRDATWHARIRLLWTESTRFQLPWGENRSGSSRLTQTSQGPRPLGLCQNAT